MHGAEQSVVLMPEVLTDEVDDSEAKMYNTIPMPSYSVLEETEGILPFVHNG